MNARGPVRSGGAAARGVAAALVTAVALGVGACGEFLLDAATAIAYDLESHTARMARSGAPTSTLVHVPKGRRGGCADAYRVQFSQAAGLVVWCRSPEGGTANVSSHITTYHLRFVDVPRTIIVDKARGEALTIELARMADAKPAVLNVR